ncbi:hypothetical protein FACS189434_14520 [Bacteroidia bacterium]|nr:hypothetical protein FACS189434_14520 [Bacteroidia bacterium]
MQKERLIQLIETPSRLQRDDFDEVQSALLAYPFCQTLLMLYAKSLQQFKPQKYDAELKKIALSVNRSQLFFLINEEFSEKTAEILPQNPFDYISYLEKKEPFSESQEPKTSQTDLLIDAFIEKNPKMAPLPDNIENQQEKPVEEEFFSETLAKIYIKQKKYEKAIKIFEKLSLQYPEKSIYFAPQINFLKIIIENQQKN